jgi:hypothetical protein
VSTASSKLQAPSACKSSVIHNACGVLKAVQHVVVPAIAKSACWVLQELDPILG